MRTSRWQYICYVICWWKWLNRIFKAVARPDNLSHDAPLSSRTSRVCDIFRSRSLKETLSHTLTLNYFLSDSSGAFDETWSPQVHLVTLGASCAQALTFKPLKRRYKNGPIWVSGLPVPPRAARRCSGIPPRSLALQPNSSPQTGFSLRSAGRAVTSTPTTSQSDTNRKNPNWLPPRTHDDDQARRPMTARVTMRKKAGAGNSD